MDALSLVLLPQGIENFARRVLAVQERRPKVAVCVVHELLTTEFAEGRGQVYTRTGIRRTLTEYGYDVIDVVLKELGIGRVAQRTQTRRGHARGEQARALSERCHCGIRADSRRRGVALLPEEIQKPSRT